MPDKNSHLAVANRNQEVIDRLLTDGNNHPEWVAVVAFYKALHVIDAVLFVDHGTKHGGSHDNRSQLLKTTHRYKNLYKHYRELFAASLVARYLENYGQEYRTFNEYMAPDEVISILLKHHLFQLERSAEKIIGALEPPPAIPAAPSS